MNNVFLYEKDIYIDKDVITIDQLPKYGEYFVINTYLEYLTTEIIYKINKIQLEKGIKYYINLLNNKEKKLDLISNEDQIGVFFRKRRNRCDSNIENVQIFEKKKCTVKNLKEFMDNSILSMMIDGSNWRVHMSDGFVLGNNRNIKIESSYKYPDHVQKIINDGNSEYILSANDFVNKHIFLNSCSDSLTDRSLYGSNLNVVQNMLKNTHSVISGFRMKVGDESENILHVQLLKKGYSLPDIHYILNLNSTLNLAETSPYINFGDIENSIDEDKKKYEVEMDVNFCIDVPNIIEQNSFYEFVLVTDQSLIDDLIMKKYKLVFRSRNEEIYCSCIPDKYSNTIKIFLYALEPFSIEAGDLKIIANDSDSNIYLEYLEIKISNIESLISRLPYSKKTDNRLKNLKMNIKSLLKNLPDYCSDTLEFYGVIDEVHKMEKSFYEQCLNEFDEKFSYGFPIEKLHENANVYSRDFSECECPKCGSPIFLKETHQLIDKIKRVSATCRECQNVYDRSVHSYEENKDLVSFETKHRGNKVEIIIRIKNEHSFRSSFFLLMYNTTDYSTSIDDINIKKNNIHSSFFVCDSKELKQISIFFDRKLLDNEVEKFIDTNIYIFDNGSLEFFSNKTVFYSRTIPSVEKQTELITRINLFLKEYLPAKRVNHSINVSNQAKLLAEHYNVNSYDAEIAGLLHDCAKNYYNNCKLLAFLEENLIPYRVDDMNFSHAHVGKIIANKFFGIDDEQILSSIFWHTNGRVNMNLLEKIIFVSDYISEERTFENVEEIRKLAYSDLDSAIGKLMDYYIEVICKKNNIIPNQYELECRNYYL